MYNGIFSSVNRQLCLAFFALIFINLPNFQFEVRNGISFQTTARMTAGWTALCHVLLCTWLFLMKPNNIFFFFVIYFFLKACWILIRSQYYSIIKNFLSFEGIFLFFRSFWWFLEEKKLWSSIIVLYFTVRILALQTSSSNFPTVKFI